MPIDRKKERQLMQEGLQQLMHRGGAPTLLPSPFSAPFSLPMQQALFNGGPLCPPPSLGPPCPPIPPGLFPPPFAQTLLSPPQNSFSSLISQLQGNSMNCASIPPTSNNPNEESNPGMGDCGHQFASGNGLQFPFGGTFPFPLPIPPLVMPSSNQANYFFDSPLIMSLLNKCAQQNFANANANANQGNKPQDTQGPDSSSSPQCGSSKDPPATAIPPFLNLFAQNGVGGQNGVGMGGQNGESQCLPGVIPSTQTSPNTSANLLAFLNSLLRMSTNTQTTNATNVTCTGPTMLATNPESSEITFTSSQTTCSMISPENSNASSSNPNPLSPTKLHDANACNGVRTNVNVNGMAANASDQKVIA